MKTILHTAESRGKAMVDWLDSYHSFSFGSVYDPERMNFGAIRVLNDDTVSKGMGFGTHPHQNMEIISIPLEGELEHQDSLGNTHVIRKDDIQVMSAGTGIQHSEYNRSKEKPTKFLQIWLIPREADVEPRYDQITLSEEQKQQEIIQILSPNKEDAGVWVHQDAWFHLVNTKEAKEIPYQYNKEGNGLYVFVLEGSTTIEGQALNARDGFGVWETMETILKVEKDTKLLLMEVPMDI